jgi:mediator of replication checkpoint protein 1
MEVENSVPAPEPVASKPKPECKQLTKPPVRVRFSREAIAHHQKEDSDDDLEVITSPAKCRKIAAFENLPARQAQESTSMLRLRLLAHLTSPTSRSKSMSPAELSASLRLQARQQALNERRERIEELRSKGVIIETAEERAAMEADVEDLLEKARNEAAEIARRERAARKKEGEGDGDSEDDDDYVLSGSEDGEEDEAKDDDDEEPDSEQEDEEEYGEDDNGLVDNEAGEADESEDERSEIMSLDGDQEAPVQAVPRKRRTRVISDDEDEEPEQQAEVKTPIRSVMASASSAKRPQFPDMPVSNGFTMGLTQAFAGTLGDSEPDKGEYSFKIIQSLPDPGLPVAEMFAADSQVMVKDSQEQRRGSIDLLAGYTQSDVRISESPAPRTWSQASQIPEPTQDAGFVFSPFDQTKRFVEPPISTIDTVVLPAGESPILKKRGRLLQRGRPAQLSDAEDDGFEIKASAFDVMKMAAKKPMKPFDKIKSKAKDHIDEAAEESEDEYAGLGGASDDEAGEEDEHDRRMINDNSGEVVDEKELAVLNA